MEEKEYQDNGELQRKPYNFFKQQVKRKIRIGEKEYVRSELTLMAMQLLFRRLLINTFGKNNTI